MPWLLPTVVERDHSDVQSDINTAISREGAHLGLLARIELLED